MQSSPQHPLRTGGRYTTSFQPLTGGLAEVGTTIDSVNKLGHRFDQKTAATTTPVEHHGHVLSHYSKAAGTDHVLDYTPWCKELAQPFPAHGRVQERLEHPAIQILIDPVQVKVFKTLHNL